MEWYLGESPKESNGLNLPWLVHLWGKETRMYCISNMTDPKFPPKTWQGWQWRCESHPAVVQSEYRKGLINYYQYKQTIPTLSAKWLMSECSWALQYQFFMRNQHMKGKIHILPHRSKQVELTTSMFVISLGINYKRKPRKPTGVAEKKQVTNGV